MTPDVASLQQQLSDALATSERLEDALVAEQNIRHEWAGRAEVAEALHGRIWEQVEALVTEMRDVVSAEREEWAPRVPVESLQVDLSAAQLALWADQLTAISTTISIPPVPHGTRDVDLKRIREQVKALVAKWMDDANHCGVNEFGRGGAAGMRNCAAELADVLASLSPDAHDSQEGTKANEEGR